jgi:hypothetical protein
VLRLTLLAADEDKPGAINPVFKNYYATIYG